MNDIDRLRHTGGRRVVGAFGEVASLTGRRLSLALAAVDAASAAFYASNARDIAARYEAGMSSMAQHFAHAFPPGGRILDVGAGSGRDLAFLLRSGFDAHGVEPVAELRDEALRLHPELVTYVVGWDASSLRARLTFGMQGKQHEVPAQPERRYALRTVQQRLHQAFFRDAVISAYAGRCALSGLPEPLLLDAPHIVADAHQDLGHPIVQNGIPLSTIHHAAFDAHLIGIDPDFKVHVAPRLLSQNDGPLLEALKRLDGGRLHLPTRMRDHPDRERLALRSADFRAAA